MNMLYCLKTKGNKIYLKFINYYTKCPKHRYFLSSLYTNIIM